MEQKVPRRPGRPPRYDRDEVIDKAQALFWKQGAAVSVDGLSAATGLHKPSLYGAFGGRRGLYLAALDAYIERGAPDVQGALKARPLRSALADFFEADLDVFCAAEDRPGCFLIGTAIEAARGDDQVRVRIEAVFAGLRRTLRARVESAIGDGDLPADADVGSWTEIIFGAHVSLAVGARAGIPRDELRTWYGNVLRLLDSQAGEMRS
jgi:AcrR family transcriptional regulator